MRHLVTGLTATCAVATAALAPVVIAPAAQGAQGAQRVAGATASPAARAALLATARAGSARTASALKLGSGERLVVKDVVRDADGSEHVRYDRTFDGLRVIGGDLVAHEDRTGAVRSVSWNASGKVAVASTTPTVSATAALAKAAPQGLRAAAAPKGELVVYAAGATPVLAYDVVTEGVRADQTPSRQHTVVDARTGRTLTSWDDIEQGTGKGIFVGTVNLATTLSGSTYQMKDGHANTATDLKGGTSGLGTLFTDADDVWGNGAVSDRASAAVDAFYGAQKTYDYYNTVLGRAGIFGRRHRRPARGCTTATTTSTPSGTAPR